MDVLATEAANGVTLPSRWEFSCDLEVDYGSDENASIVYAALAVDKELQPDKVNRQMSVTDGKLFQCILKRLRKIPLCVIQCICRYLNTCHKNS